MTRRSQYAVSSANSMIAALNQFLSFLELEKLKLKQFRVQRADIERKHHCPDRNRRQPDHKLW